MLAQLAQPQHQRCIRSASSVAAAPAALSRGWSAEKIRHKVNKSEQLIFWFPLKLEGIGCELAVQHPYGMCTDCTTAYACYVVWAVWVAAMLGL